MSTKEHKAHAPKSLRIAVVTVSSTRTLADDKSGQWITKRAKKKGHDVMSHQVVPDDKDVIANTISTVIEEFNPHMILVTGGTGISSKDAGPSGAKTTIVQPVPL